VTALLLSNAQRAQIEAEACAAFPRECCGLLEGVREGDAIRILALHPAHNLSSESSRFEIDPADHFAALRAARANGHEIAGCYHSHPNGKCEPSARDGEGAWDEGFVWLIAAIRDGVVSLAAFVREASAWQKLELAEIAEKAA
jgi:proteasome lid subunit RPN8/RPN11